MESIAPEQMLCMGYREKERATVTSIMCKCCGLLLSRVNNMYSISIQCIPSRKRKCCVFHILRVNAVDSVVMKKKGKQKSMTGFVASLIPDIRGCCVCHLP